MEGLDPGAELRLPASAPAGVRVRAVVHSIAPVDSLEILVNGKPAEAVKRAAGSNGLEFNDVVAIPDGGWIAARVVGPPSKAVADSYAFAQTTPVYVVRGDKPWASKEDAKFLTAVVPASFAYTARA